MNVPLWKYSIPRLCTACYCNTHLTGQSSEHEGFDTGTRFQCCARLTYSVPHCGHTVTPGCRTVSVSAMHRCTHRYECSLCLSWGCLPVPAEQKGHAAGLQPRLWPSPLQLVTASERTTFPLCVGISDFHHTHSHTSTLCWLSLGI